MSIHDLWSKIKSRIAIDKITILYLFILLIVSLSSFGLGRLSVPFNNDQQINTASTNNQTASTLPFYEQSSTEARYPSMGNSRSVIDNRSNINTVDKQNISSNEGLYSNNNIGKNYVASKNGKRYYPKGCGAANRIKPSNEVWFSTSAEAESLGYTRSASCK